MILDLNKSYIIRKGQTDDSVSFRVCFADEERNWLGADFIVPKKEFKDISGQVRLIATDRWGEAMVEERNNGWKSISQGSPAEGETK